MDINVPEALNEILGLLSIKMYTSEEVSVMLKCSTDQLKMWREVGVLEPIHTSKNYMYSRDAILEFQKDYKGMDVSNKVQALLSFEKVQEKKSTAHND